LKDDFAVGIVDKDKKPLARTTEAIGLKLLSKWLVYLKDNEDKADITELQKITNTV
jgi:hypothetical protein